MSPSLLAAFRCVGIYTGRMRERYELPYLGPAVTIDGRMIVVERVRYRPVLLPTLSGVIYRASRHHAD